MVLIACVHKSPAARQIRVAQLDSIGMCYFTRFEDSTLRMRRTIRMTEVGVPVFSETRKKSVCTAKQLMSIPDCENPDSGTTR